MVLSTGSKALANWTSPAYGMLAYKKVSGATVVSLNAYLANIGTFTSTTMNELYGNTILFSLGYLPEPITYVSIYNNDDTQQFSITGVTFSGATTGNIPVGEPSSGDSFPLLYGENNTGFTTTQWGEFNASGYFKVYVGVDVTSTPVTGSTYLSIIGSDGSSFFTGPLTSGGTYTVTSEIISGDMVNYPSGSVSVGIYSV
jgi:hypothetical protein